MSQEPKATEEQKTRTLYILAQHGAMADARKAKLPAGARLVEALPLDRLTDECMVGVLYRGEGRKAVDCAKHWNGESMELPAFISEIAKSALPLVVRIKDNVLSLRWA
jgi:hypothetical protein